MKRKQVRRQTRRTVRRVVRPSYEIIAVKFDRATSGVYHYRAPTRWNIDVGDKVIVDSPLSGYTVVTVVNVFDEASSCTYRGVLKRIVSTIDDREYLTVKEQDELERKLLLQAEQRRNALAQLSKFPTSAKVARLLDQLEREMALR